MKSWILIAAAFGLMQVVTALAEGDEAAEPDNANVEELINQLDSDIFAEREEAVVQLTNLGRPAIESLTAAAQEGSAEAQFRALRVLSALYRSEDEATEKASREALKVLAKSDNLGTRRSAEKILATPKYEIPLGIWRGEGGIRIGAGGQLILASADGENRRVDLIKGTGVGVLLLESRNGIEIHVRQPQEAGDPKFTRYLAKDSKELADNYPSIHKLYTTLDVYRKNQTVIGGVKIEP